MLQDCLGLVGLDTLGHHVQNIMHDGSTQLEIVVGLDTLLGHCLGNALGVTTLEMSCQQVSEPALQQWYDTAQEEQPHSPARSPESTSWSLSDWSCVETVVDNVLQILALFIR